MKEVQDLFTSVAGKLEALARANAVVGPTTTVDGRHVIPLVELSLGVGGAGGSGEGADPKSGAGGAGMGGGAGGGAKATPVAVIVVEAGNVQVEFLDH